MLLKFALVAFVLEEVLCIYCDEDSIQKVGRVVFGEARGESYEGQGAVALTVVNRIKSNLYPNTLDGVLGATYAHGTHHEYNTLDEDSHTIAWNNAKRDDTSEYQEAIMVTRAVLCDLINKRDPRWCFTAYCATYITNCSALQDNKYSRVTSNVTIGGHTFVCRESISQTTFG